MNRLFSLIFAALLGCATQSAANDEAHNQWIINEVDDPFSKKIKLSVHVEYKTTDSKTQLPIYAALDITGQPNPHSAVEAIALISHTSPYEPQPIATPARKLRLSVDNESPVELMAYFQTDRGSAFGTKHWYLFDLDCHVLAAMADGDVLELDTPEVSTIKLSGARKALSQVFPDCFSSSVN